MDFFLKIIDFLPKYAEDLFRMTTRPKTYLAGLDTKDDGVAKESIQFALLSIALSVGLFLPFDKLSTHIIMYSLASVTLQTIFYVWMIWKSHVWLGGEIDLRQVLIVNLYFVGVLNLITFLFGLFPVFIAFQIFPNFSVGLIMPHLPASFYLQGREIQQINLKIFFSLLIFVIPSLLTVFWAICVWGAYRYISGISKARSFIAFLTSGIGYLLFIGFLILCFISVYSIKDQSIQEAINSLGW